MGNLRRWSSSASGNATVTGGVNTINFAEGQLPGSVNNSAREMMAQVRGIYIPSDWGWIENSVTASVASQTTFKLAGNQTTDYAAGRRWRLKSGSSTRYGSIVSSSYTVETTVTVTVDSGSLSASHSLAAVSVIDEAGNHVPWVRFSSGNVGIGTTSPATKLDVVTAGGSASIFVRSESTTQVGAQRNSADGAGAVLLMKKARGTLASEAAVASSDVIGEVRYQAYGGTNNRVVASIIGGVDTYTSDTDISSYIALATSPTGGVTATERFRIRANGDAVVTGSGGLGYGTGSGGTVTQLTSKSTGVTLAKTNGQIVTHNASLANNTTVTFTVTNSTVSSTDTVIVHRASGGTASAYQVYVDAVGSGSFNVSIRNVSGGSLSEALTLNFAVIKAVTS